MVEDGAPSHTEEVGLPNPVHPPIAGGPRLEDADRRGLVDDRGQNQDLADDRDRNPSGGRNLADAPSLADDALAIPNHRRDRTFGVGESLPHFGEDDEMPCCAYLSATTNKNK